MTPSAFLFDLTVSLILGALSVLAWNKTPGEWICDCGAEKGAGLLLQDPEGIPVSVRCLPALAVTFGLIQLSVCDVRYQILQDQWILFLGPAGLFFPVGPGARITGVLIPLAAFAAWALAARAAGRTCGLGAGDAKLAAGLGFAFGAPAAAAMLCRAFLWAGMVALCLLLTKKAAKGDRMAFGPFAALACYCYLLSTFSM
jgi:prepilin signal peptidase PulO-like enzyme (type II secretory pathway)